MEKSNPQVDFSLKADDVRQISKSLDFHFANWPDGRDGVEEQSKLRRLRYMFRAALMEISYQTES